MRPIVAKILKNFVDDKYGSVLGVIVLLVSLGLLAANLIDKEIFFTLLGIACVLMGIDTKLTKKK